MKLQDPTTPFADVIARRRRERVVSDTEHFRLDGRPPIRNPRPSSGAVAVVGASDWALEPSRAERTFAHIGALAGLLADLGYDVHAVSSLSRLDAQPSFVGWVGGHETTAEQDQLVALETHGLAVGATVAGIESWGSVKPDDHPNSIEFVRAALHEIRRLADSDDPSSMAPAGAGASNGTSNGSNETPREAEVEDGTSDPRNPSSGTPRGTRRHRPRRPRSDS